MPGKDQRGPSGGRAWGSRLTTMAGTEEGGQTPVFGVCELTAQSLCVPVKRVITGLTAPKKGLEATRQGQTKARGLCSFLPPPCPPGS